MNQPKDAASEARALQAVERHHAHMLKQLNGLVALLMEAVEAGDSGAEGTAQATLLDWCDSELVPPALAEAVKGLHELTGEGSGDHAEAHDGGAHQR